jgi:hypothetical protein
MQESGIRNQQGARVEIEIMPGATHLFEEPGTLEEVERLAGKWLTRHLRRSVAH